MMTGYTKRTRNGPVRLKDGLRIAACIATLIAAGLIGATRVSEVQLLSVIGFKLLMTIAMLSYIQVLTHPGFQEGFPRCTNREFPKYNRVLITMTALTLLSMVGSILYCLAFSSAFSPFPIIACFFFFQAMAVIPSSIMFRMCIPFLCNSSTLTAALISVEATTDNCAFEEALTIGAILNLALAYYFLRVWIFQTDMKAKLEATAKRIDEEDRASAQRHRDYMRQMDLLRQRQAARVQQMRIANFFRGPSIPGG
ncbi:hypothetical protein PRIPAC_97934 [Pristionchus pacificus]|uniref:Uncharacterized protein n=1 Tax=Pristionchus pacificus TaxID=54126 RepID=A0A2A6CV20_PRIPA|nr:hypothetical protein PRIPAC_97934 [Pristionchus pacificus]|eukprot:PDM81887.1 hypothetical protein PRIPAC_34041 [Pristionchus pacificus]